MMLPLLIRDSYTTCALTVRSLDSVITKYTPDNAKVLNVIPYSHLAYPTMLRTHRRPASRYLWTYPLTWYSYLENHSRSHQEWLSLKNEERKVVDELYEDALLTRPSLIVISKAASDPSDQSWTVFRSLDQDGFTTLLYDYQPIEPANLKYSLWLRKNKEID
jgi:hypothetical protein